VGLPERQELRVGDRERQAVVDELRTHFGAGRLELHEFEDRTARALAARIVADLVPLTADLPAVRTSTKGPPIRQPDRQPVRGWDLLWQVHYRFAAVLAAAFLLVALIFFVGWPFWVIFGLGISVGAHGAVRWTVRG
jgi:hypothetical protein